MSNRFTFLCTKFCWITRAICLLSSQKERNTSHNPKQWQPVQLKLKNISLVNENIYLIQCRLTAENIYLIYLFCVAATLDKAEATSVWQPPEWEPNQRLAIRQLMLSHKAKANEFNVVEVSNNQIFIKSIKINHFGIYRIGNRLKLHL